MKRNCVHTAIAIALAGTLALVGCKQQPDPTAMTPPPVSAPAIPAPMPAEPAPAPATLNVSTIDLGSAVGADNRVTTPMTSFAQGDTVHASVATDGAAGNLTAKWTMSDMGEHVVDTQDKPVAAGPQVTEFSVSNPATGKDKLEVSSNGVLVQSREFDVK